VCASSIPGDTLQFFLIFVECQVISIEISAHAIEDGSRLRKCVYLKCINLGHIYREKIRIVFEVYAYYL
jgi:hypothetical protein